MGWQHVDGKCTPSAKFFTVFSELKTAYLDDDSGEQGPNGEQDDYNDFEDSPTLRTMSSECPVPSDSVKLRTSIFG
jgi:hypothetical protein